jgi:hypothetical protein
MDAQSEGVLELSGFGTVVRGAGGMRRLMGWGSPTLARRALVLLLLAAFIAGLAATPAGADEDLCLGIDADGDGVIDQLPPPSGCIVVPFLVEPEKNNTIDLAFHTIHVAVPWTPDFDYMRIKDVPLCFGDADDPSRRACTPVTGKSKFRDVNFDGKRDRVWKWDTGLTGVQPGDTSACIYGTTTDGANLEACDRATVINGDGPTLTINDVSVVEGNAGQTPATLTVTLAPASTEPVTVDYTTADFNATAPDDYQSTSGQLTFAPGDTSQTVTVWVVGDTLLESNESFSVNLSAAVGAVIGDVRGSATIVNDDSAPPPTPSVSIGDASVTEGDSGATPASFAVSLSSASADPVTVSWATADGTAVSPGDYVGALGQVTFAPAETSKSISVDVVGDDVLESNESFTVELSSPVGAVIADGSGLGTILDDDGAVTASVGDVSVTEGDAGTTVASFPVSLSQAAGQAVSVSYQTADGTAMAPEDYQAASGSITFQPGETAQSVSVFVLGDTVVEPTEVFYLDISSMDASVTDGRGDGTITNDDVATSIAISDVTVTEGTGSPTYATFVVTLSAASGSPVSVSYQTTNGTAAAPADYQAASGVLTFAAGETSKTIQVTVEGDSLRERGEYFFVTLSDASGATIADSSGRCNIADND